MGVGKLEIILSVIIGSSAIGFAQTTTDVDKVQDEPKKIEKVIAQDMSDYTLSGKLFSISEEHIRAIESSYDLNKELNVTLRKFLFKNKRKIAKNDKKGNPMVDMKKLLRNKTNIYQPILVNQLINSFCDVECSESIIALNALAVIDGKPTYAFTEEDEKLLVESGTLKFLDDNWNSVFKEQDKEYFFKEIKKGRLYKHDLELFLWKDSSYVMHMLTLDPEIRGSRTVSASIYANWRFFRDLPEDDKTLEYKHLLNYNLKPRP